MITVIGIKEGSGQSGTTPFHKALLARDRYGIKRAPKRQLIHTYIDTSRWVPHLKRGCGMGCTEA